MFSRLAVNLDGVIFFRNNEHPAKVANISEEGIGVLISDRPADGCDFSPGDELYIEFIDEFRWPRDWLDEFHILKARVAQVRTEKGKCYLGCRVIRAETDYRRYVEKRKCHSFIKSLRNGCVFRRE